MTCLPCVVLKRDRPVARGWQQWEAEAQGESTSDRLVAVEMLSGIAKEAHNGGSPWSGTLDTYLANIRPVTLMNHDISVEAASMTVRKTRHPFHM
jgi:hypothetical protein